MGSLRRCFEMDACMHSVYWDGGGLLVHLGSGWEGGFISYGFVEYGACDVCFNILHTDIV